MIEPVVSLILAVLAGGLVGALIMGAL